MYSYQPFVNVKLLWKINLKIQLEFMFWSLTIMKTALIDLQRRFVYLPCLMFCTGDVIFQ